MGRDKALQVRASLIDLATKRHKKINKTQYHTKIQSAILDGFDSNL